VDRGERLIKLGNSWFSAKSIEVDCFIFLSDGVEHSLNAGDICLTKFKETPNTSRCE